MIVSPAICIVEIFLLSVNLVECHESLVVHGACPQVAGTYSFDKGIECRVAVLCHEIVVGAMSHLHDFLFQVCYVSMNFLG